MTHPDKPEKKERCGPEYPECGWTANGPWDSDLIERLSALEHSRWSDWHRFMVRNQTPENIQRWDRQSLTPYEDLTEREKSSDRREVYRYLPVILSWLKENGWAKKDCGGECTLQSNSENFCNKHLREFNAFHLSSLSQERDEMKEKAGEEAERRRMVECANTELIEEIRHIKDREAEVLSKVENILAHEINPSNYDHDEVCLVNSQQNEAVCFIRETLRSYAKAGKGAS